ncbi:DNA repair ATPase [Pseudomonas aeruginosa]|nr:DNA repair ATPase [Pseudomonas aeruginosa]
MSDTQAATPAQDVLDKAVAEGGAYEVLHKRLLEQGQRLRQTAERLNASRLEEFGDSQMDVIGRVRIRTENNCIARDIVQVGDCLLFGYNVFIGLRKETGVADVFSLYRLVEGSEGYEAEPVPLGDSFLAAPGFVNDFNELYTYYKNTRLLQLAIRDGKLLASFQIGERITDIRVFRWSISSDGSEVRYIDNRGERDIALPAPFDFEWQRATREMVVEGRFPHLNILDTLFVETIGGDLTIKVENNTEVGLGIYREEVMDKTQSLDDAQVEFARLGSLLLLKVLPYREEQWRYLVFNSLTGKVERIDAIGLACIQLPEDHGIIFPGGYYLQNGEYRTFEQSMEGMRFKRSVRSPNGEDVQYVFYHPEQGRNVLLTYNLINRQLQNPLFGHGYARLEDGRMVIFAAEGEEPTRIHPMQVWQTPFCTEEYAARQPARSGFLGRSAMPSWCAASPTSTTCAGRSRPRRFRSSATRCCARTPSACSTSTTGSAATNWTAWRRCCAKWRRPPSWCSTSTRRSKVSAASRPRLWSTRRSGTRRCSPACCPTAGTGCSSSSTGSMASPPSVGCC